MTVTLTDAGANALLEQPSARPATYIVWHKPPAKGARWRKVGRAATHAGAVRMIAGAGDWWIATLASADLAGDPAAARQPSLFDDAL